MTSIRCISADKIQQSIYYSQSTSHTQLLLLFLLRPMPFLLVDILHFIVHNSLLFALFEQLYLSKVYTFYIFELHPERMADCFPPGLHRTTCQCRKKIKKNLKFTYKHF